MVITPYDVVGFIGAALMVGAYFANQERWLRSDDWRFPGANLLGSVLILVSLWVEWNFPSVIIELFWALISVLGLIKARRSDASA